MSANCPLCNNDNFEIVYGSPPQFPDADIVQCNNCGHIYTMVRSEIDTDKLYSDEVYQVVENRNSIFDRIIQTEYKGVLHHLDRFLKRKGNLLDFGTGKGQFGNLAKKDGWLVKAVETSTARATYARSVYGLDVNSDFYTTGSIFNISFDAITLFHVLEHLSEPGKLLNELIKNNSVEKGMVIIEVPNINSWQSKIAKEKWIHLDVPRHTHHFSSERLEKLMNEIDLRLLKKTTFSFHVGILGMVDSLLKKAGYKRNIIYELKNKKSAMLILFIALIFPFAFASEYLASLSGNGGVIRMYLSRK